MNLLIDTHVFIWWDDDYEQLPEPLQDELANPQNTIYLSLASVWEMQIKTQLGKLKFSVPLPQKVQDQQSKNRIELLPITKAHIYAVDELPFHHRDPFDRLLIAQARTDNLILVTHDTNIQQYSVITLWDIPPKNEKGDS
jgi:PIN domain nuclease of toxin-antitoxin system